MRIKSNQNYDSYKLVEIKQKMLHKVSKSKFFSKIFVLVRLSKLIVGKSGILKIHFY